jgi:hypothetical protein
VDTAAETTIGGYSEVEDLGLLGLGFLDGDVLEKLCAERQYITPEESRGMCMWMGMTVNDRA